MRTIKLCFAILLFPFYSISQDFTPEHVEPFMDGVIESQLRDKNISGATLSIIKDGEKIVHKGYGYSDYFNRVPVDPDQTLFRIGSVSKLFVWLAVMQMVEEGKLDLDRDVNDYLTEFKIPDTFEDPITMRHIMSHTPGFEDRLIKLFSTDSLSIKPLGSILPNEIPKRVRPSGVQASYSNHATAIAAHIVEIVSGMEWNDYVEQNIFDPLKMHSTTFRQPIPGYLKDNISKGYAFEKGAFVEKPFEYIPLAPAGSVSTTAADMVLFMKMLLNNGSLDNTVIIDDTTFCTMLKPVITHAPRVNPCLHGFMDMTRKGVSIYGHGGDTFWFHTLLAILPEQNMGIFLSFNGDKGGSAYSEVMDMFLDKYLQNKDTLLPPIALDDEYLARFAGEYKVNRYSHSDYLKILSLMSRIKVTVDQGKLRVMEGNKANFYLPVDSLTFRKEFNSEAIVFQSIEEEKARYAFLSTLSVFAFERATFCEEQTLHFSIFLIVIVLSIVTVFYWPMVFFIRSKYFAIGSVPKPLPISAKLIAWITSALLLSFYLGVTLSTSGGPEVVVYTVPTGLKNLLVIPILLIPLNLVMIFKMITVWPLISTRVRSKVFYTLICFAHIAALWQLYFWNLIGWNY